MSKKAPLYEWEKDVTAKQEKNLKKFLNKDFRTKRFKDRYIYPHEIKIIAKEFDLDLYDLTPSINKKNKKFVEKKKEKVLKEFNRFLNSRDEPILDKEEIRKKYNEDYCDFYEELSMSEKIDDFNFSLRMKQNKPKKRENKYYKLDKPINRGGTPEVGNYTKFNR